jgi:hypothetical protein
MIFNDGLSIVGGLSAVTARPYSESTYTTPGTYSWVAPEGIFFVSAVCLGGGGAGGIDPAGNFNDYVHGGGGAGLGWHNSVSVIPNQTYTVVVGMGGNALTANVNGGDSYFISNSIVCGFGGKGATLANGRGMGGTYIGQGGGNGGAGGSAGGTPGGGLMGGGGGGAGGYSGAGGSGTAAVYGINPGTQPGTDGSGGGGGGGGAVTEVSTIYTSSGGGGGGGIGILGQGTNGNRGGQFSAVAPDGGGGGSDGTSGSSGGYVPDVRWLSGGNGGNGGLYGGGGGGSGNDSTGITGVGANGFVRIIWGGPVYTRLYPKTGTGNLTS